MTPDALIEAAYAAFNSRDIDAALALMDADVVWPNGMEGGVMNGRGEIRAYWTRQWTIVNPRVEPLSIRREPDGRYAVKVHQLVKDVGGLLLADRVVEHVYSLHDGRIGSMEIRE